MRAGLYHRHFVIRSHQQLKATVTYLERSKFRAQKPYASLDDFGLDVGRHITHVRLLAMPHLPIEKTAPPLSFFERRMTDPGMWCLDGGLSGSCISYLRRLLSCCPNLQVLLDATPLASTNQYFPFLGSLASNAVIPKLRALEHTQGNPRLGDIYTSPDVANTLTRLRGLKLHFHPTLFTPQGALNLPNLTSLDLHISSSHFSHWRDAARALVLPSLTHLTVRAPFSAAPFLGAQARECLERFLTVFGAGITSLELIIARPPVAIAVASTTVRRRQASQTGEDLYDVPVLLQFCPSLRDLVMDIALMLYPWVPNVEIDGASHGSNVWLPPSLYRIGLRGVEISALLTNIEYTRLQPLKPIPPPNPETPCQFCSVYKREDPSIAEQKITRSLHALFGSVAPPVLSSSPLAVPKGPKGTSNSLKEIHFLPSPLNTPRAPGEIEPRACCLRGAPPCTAISRWQELCQSQRVELRIGMETG